MNISKADLLSNNFGVYLVKKSDLHHVDLTIFWMSDHIDHFQDVPDDMPLCMAIGNGYMYLSDRMFFVKWW